MSDIINKEPMEITIGEKTFKAKKLNISEIFGFFENIIHNEKIKNATKACESFTADEKFDFMERIINKLPSGDDIINLCSERVASLKGCKEVIYLSTKDLNEGVDGPDYFNNLITVDNVKSLDPIVNRLTGFGEVKKIRNQNRRRRKR